MLATPALAAPRPVLAVCADPSNLPYSNAKLQGFENKIATLLATDLHAELRYTWNLERRGFFRRTLFAHVCDVVISVPAALPTVATTRPYFTASYVAVTRADAPFHPISFDDPALRQARIGVQLVGAEGANTPPAMALGRRGITDHITGFAMWADDTVANPQGRIVDAVAHRGIDIAYVWGPFADYFARPYGARLRLDPITADPKMPLLTFTYPMAIAVRRDDLPLRDTLQAAIDRHPTEIAAILRRYGIPTQETAHAH